VKINKRTSSGMTLVELMVSLAIMGGLSLVMLAMLGEHSRKSAQVNADVQLSERSQEFTQIFDSTVAGVTQWLSCNCNNSCTWSERASFSDDGDTVDTIATFVSEGSTDPEQVAGGPCLGAESNPAPGSPSGLLLRGCKGVFGLTFRRPRLAFSPGGAYPGALQLRQAIGTNVTSPDKWKVLFELPGVYQIRCGHPEVGAGTSRPLTAKNAFKMEISMKAGLTPKNCDASRGITEDCEIWTLKERVHEKRGTFRSITTETTFKNLVSRGVVFGKARSLLTCIPDGKKVPDNQRIQCCSGYSVKGECMEARFCVSPGPGADNPPFNCCSHDVDPLQPRNCR
jgi:prepilin-type N-terminal cleavage/methylation domain-containing protein